jgi:hypothetical protein
MLNLRTSRTGLLGSTALLISATAAMSQDAPRRDVFFGQTHVHTSWSLDAYIIGNHLTDPEDSYKFAIGQPVKHPAGFDVQLKRPLDFQGVTDHSEYVGMMKLANDPSSPISKLPISAKLKVNTPADVNTVFKYLVTSLVKQQPIEELRSPEVAGNVWKENVDIADKYYKPGKFTTFASYEWTSAPNNRNMHRNVFFKDTKKVPELPFTAIDSLNPEDLWTWMDKQRKDGNEVLAISHNGNLSDGIMFPVDVDSKGRPIDAAWAQQRLDNEPLSEIHQLKGTSETHPLLSPNDEFADYEIMSYLIGVDNSTSRVNGSYFRQAYQNGMAMQDASGYNPYKFGIVAASDSHNTAVSYTQHGYFGGHAFMDGSAKARLAGMVESGMEVLKLSTSGLAGVWADQNDRPSIFEAMQRKEVYGTSGVRIKVRMFGGWNFEDGAVNRDDWASVGYTQGVPMGGDLPAAKGGEAPVFMLWALKDPDDANLDRIQVIKGWTKNGQIFERIYDVAWSGQRTPDPATGKVSSVGSTVDISNASYTDSIGAVELKTTWIDPDFDPSLHAFYYARVLQIPTPRWSTYDAKELGEAPPARVSATVQERAWTSPIWYTPTGQERQQADAGSTVTDLTQKGATALDNAALTSLIVGKTITVRNTVTGEEFDAVYGTDGSRVITKANGGEPTPGDVFAAFHSSALTGPTRYEIRDNRIVTMIDNTPFEVTVYKLGDSYIAARNNEFGHANYEIQSIADVQ